MGLLPSFMPDTWESYAAVKLLFLLLGSLFYVTYLLLQGSDALFEPSFALCRWYLGLWLPW